MTREEIDILWSKALVDAVRDGEKYTRYHFAAMVAEAERNACAVVAEGLVRKQHKHVNGGRPFTDHMHWEDIAAAIRARGLR